MVMMDHFAQGLALALRDVQPKPAPPSPAELERIKATCERWANLHPYQVLYHRVFDGDDLARLLFWREMVETGHIGEGS